ncbi:MAG: hypothetical protein NTZ21_09500 [Actinobacteria bacterium]|nr:hypothetical protein [Actinomycetota bacterium]
MRRSPVVTALVLAVLASGCQDAGDGGAVATVSPSTSTSPSTSVAPPATDVDATEPATTEPATTEPATTEPATTEPATTEPAVPTATYEVATLEGSVTDPARDRQIPYLVYAPVGLDGAVPLILVSHGGAGSARGHLSAPHLGTTFATGGFVAIHVGHLPSDSPGGQLGDRPADITFLLDQLEAGAIEFPATFTGTIDLTRVGHTGHSFGAYTSHAVAGATYASTSGTYVDERIDAIAPISPQGPDQMGGFDRGPDDNTWMTVTIPSYNLIGGAEVDSNAVDSIVRPGWRLAPFDRYPGTSDTFRSIIADQTHSDMWRTGSTEVQQFVAGEILEFMRIYVAGDTSACDIGVGALTSVTLERHPAETGSLLDTCG